MENQTVILEKMITSLLNEKKYPSLRDILVTMNPSDIASVFDGLEPDRIPLLFRLLPKEQAAETFVEMEPDAQEPLIQGFSDRELKEVVDELYLDDAVDLVEEMPANVVRRILSQADPETRKSINELLRYPENSAGSIMTTEYVTLRPSMTVEESILRIRRTGVDKETIYTCYITDNRTPAGPCDREGSAPGRRRRNPHPGHYANPCHLRHHPHRPGRGGTDVCQIQLSGPPRCGQRKPHGGHCHLRRRHGRHGGGSD